MSRGNKTDTGGMGGGRVGGGRMGGRHGGMAPVVKAKDFRGAMAKLITYLGVHRRRIVLVMLMAAASTAFTILGPRILGGATDVLLAGAMGKAAGTGEIDFAAIAAILARTAALYAAASALAWLQGLVMSSVTAQVTYKLRSDLSVKLHRLPLGYYDKTTHGEVLSRITNDVDTISHTLNQSMSQIIVSVSTLIGILIMMLSISWRLTLVALCIMPLSIAVALTVVRKSQRYFKDQQKFLGRVNSHVEEMLGSHVVVRAFSGEEESLKTFSRHNNSLYGSAWKANFISGLMMPIIVFIGNMGYVAVCVFGGVLASGGAVTVGGIQAFIQYMRSFMQPISQVANISNVLQQTAAAAERVFEFLGESEEEGDKDAPLSAHSGGQVGTDVQGGISFKDVSFAYDGEKMVIRNLNAEVAPGQKVAIVGPTGAGKTTIVKLLMRFYDVSGGAISVGGHDIRDFKRSQLRSLFGMVLQDTWLYHGTISDNIRYGRLDATDEEVVRAAKAAQVDHFVRILPDGYQMILSEEADNISQGQKQLLTIARAILADPKILILDEATSSVDTRTEVLIQKAMDNLMKGRTSFVIAHRLSTIRNADLILVIRDGDIVEQGTHLELLERGGFYAELYSSQFEQAV